MSRKPTLSHIKGAMAGSAVGGALGNPSGLITDDTQMGLFTAEGLILSKVRPDDNHGKDIVHPVFHALLRWLYTQQVHMLGDMIKSYGTCAVVDGILMGHKELFALRNPSGTCLQVLSEGRMGTLDHLPNNARGPGALVRTLPVGFAFPDPEAAFHEGCRTAAITHGHRDAVLSSGVFAALISQVVAGQPLTWALKKALDLLKSEPEHENLSAALESALSLSGSADPAPGIIDDHFQEPTAAGTLCAGVYSALCHAGDLNRGLLLSVDHSGNIDETGAVAGALLGGLHGFNVIPGQLLDNLELKDVILEMAEDVYNQFHKQE